METTGTASAHNNWVLLRDTVTGEPLTYNDGAEVKIKPQNRKSSAYALIGGENKEAHAQVFAAAPGLLEASEIALDVLRELSHHPVFKETSYALIEGNDAIRRLESAINNAYGTPS